MTTPLPPFHPDDLAWVQENARPVTTEVGIRSSYIFDAAVLARLGELRDELAPPAPTTINPDRPTSWKRWGPHTNRNLAVVRPGARGWHLPVAIHQILGGKRWSLALIVVGPFTKDPEATS